MNRVDELKAEYMKLLHAVQTGVAWEIENHVNDAATPKQLRVGVNSALIDSSALARLLMAKGIVSEEEYFGQLVDTAREEVEAYERRIFNKVGIMVHLG